MPDKTWPAARIRLSTNHEFWAPLAFIYYIDCCDKPIKYVSIPTLLISFIWKQTAKVVCCPMHRSLNQVIFKKIIIKMHLKKWKKIARCVKQCCMNECCQIQNQFCFSCQWLRPYHVECTGSRPITEVKQRRAWLVLGWETGWEHQVL